MIFTINLTESWDNLLQCKYDEQNLQITEQYTKTCKILAIFHILAKKKLYSGEIVGRVWKTRVHFFPYSKVKLDADS